MSDLYTIETSRLLLRPFAEADAESIRRLGREPGKASSLPDWAMDGERAAALVRRLGQCWAAPDPARRPAVWAVTVKETGELIGHAGVGPKEELGGEVELGYAVSAGHAGRGYATEAARAAVWWAFERAGLPALCALALPENAASLRVLTKLGFVPAGTRTLEHGGEVRLYHCLRFYHLDHLESPEWTDAAEAEPMALFFDRRCEEYEAHMLEDPDAPDFYAEASAPLPRSDAPLAVLDLGCGTGLELNGLFRRLPNARVTCVDLSRSMLDRLLQNHRDRSGQITAVQANYLNRAWGENAFDAVLSVNTMHHFTEPVKLGVYRNILRALKPGGVYVESDFMVDDVMMEQYRRRHRRLTARLAEGGRGSHHVDLPFTPQLQTTMLRHAGFAPVKSHLERIRPAHSGAILAAYKPGGAEPSNPGQETR